LAKGVLQISSNEDDRRFFLDLKLSIPGFFGWPDLSRYFLGYLKQFEDSWQCPRILAAQFCK